MSEYSTGIELPLKDKIEAIIKMQAAPVTTHPGLKLPSSIVFTNWVLSNNAGIDHIDPDLGNNLYIWEFNPNDFGEIYFNCQDGLLARLKYWQPNTSFDEEWSQSLKITAEAAAIDQLKSLVGQAFARFDEVSGVYLQRYRRELQFKVLLNVSEYDWDLMDKLLAVEFDLIQQTPEGLCIDISYLPTDEKESMIHPSATLAFER